MSQYFIRFSQKKKLFLDLPNILYIFFISNISNFFPLILILERFPSEIAEKIKILKISLYHPRQNEVGWTRFAEPKKFTKSNKTWKRYLLWLCFYSFSGMMALDSLIFFFFFLTFYVLGP